MLKLLNAKLEILTAAKFRIIGPLISLTSDIILLFYIKGMVAQNILVPGTIHNIARLQGMDPTQFDPQDVNGLLKMMESSLLFGLTFILAYNSIIYFFCMRDKKWAKKYLKSYAFFGAFLSILEIAAVFYQYGRVNIITALTMFLYFIVYRGYKLFMKKGEL